MMGITIQEDIAKTGTVKIDTTIMSAEEWDGALDHMDDSSLLHLHRGQSILILLVPIPHHPCNLEIGFH